MPSTRDTRNAQYRPCSASASRAAQTRFAASKPLGIFWRRATRTTAARSKSSTNVVLASTSSRQPFTIGFPFIEILWHRTRQSAQTVRK